MDKRKIVDQILGIVLEMIESGEEIPPEMIDMIIKVIEDALQSQEREEAPIVPGVPEVPAGQYPSSNVNGMNYNPDTKDMLVQFHGPYPNAAGSVYRYKNIPTYLYDILSRGAVPPKSSGENRYHKWIRGISPSLGGSVNAILKAGQFQYEKIS